MDAVKEQAREDRITRFVEDILGQAEWRGQKAAEYPEDDRNQRCAIALETLAAWVMEHGDGRIVQRLNEALDLFYQDPDARFAAEIPEQQLGRYGFHHGTPETPEIFLDSLVKGIERHLLRGVKSERPEMLRFNAARRRRFNPARGGHAPGHLREALYDWIDEGMEGDVAHLDDEESFGVDWLLGQLWNCSDTLPSIVRTRLRDFDIEAGSVAAAVRAIKPKRTK